MKNLLKSLHEAWGGSWSSSTFDDEGKVHSWETKDESPFQYVYMGSQARGNGIVSYEDMEDTVGDSADKNGTNDGWAIDAPLTSEEKEALKELNPDELMANQKNLARCFNRKLDFLVLGQAGWAKSSLIKQEAQRHGYTVITAFIAGWTETDVTGIPVPQKLKNGKGIYQEMCLPGWLAYIASNPDEKICLFMDEINQATPAVLGAIQNIVLEHKINGVQYKNLICCGAGNLQDENNYLTDVKQLKPFMARWAQIDWVTDWDAYFPYLRNKYEGQLGKDFMDRMWMNHDSFMSPRDMERYVLQPMIEDLAAVKEDPRQASLYTAQDYLNDLNKYTVKDKTKTQREDLEKLADFMAMYVQSGGQAAETKATKKRSKNKEMMMENDVELLKNGMIYGTIQISDDSNVYGICRENVYYLFDEGAYNRETIERQIAKLESDGVKFKYETKKDILKDLKGINNLVVDFE